MGCLVHVIYGAYKAGVVYVQSQDGLLDTSSTRGEINKAITCTNKSQKGSVALIQAQKHCKLENVRLLAPDKNCFSYISHSFKSLCMNKDDIEYMYGPMPGVCNDINTCKPSNGYWDVVHVVVYSMKEVVASVHQN